MVTAGNDIGSYTFEKDSILEHLNVYKTIFKLLIGTIDIKLEIIKHGGYTDSDGFIEKIIDNANDDNSNEEINIMVNTSKFNNQYYKGLQFKIYINFKGSDFEVVDGGFVDWSQKLLQSKKERMLVSGMGIERLLMIIKDNI